MFYYVIFYWKSEIFPSNNWLFICSFADKADEKSVKVKILDFQEYKYNSFVSDLLHFLFYNARIDDLKAHFKSFVEHYISEFVNVMRIVNCPLEDYTNEK